MKGKCVMSGMLIIVIYTMTACGFSVPAESVMAMESEIIVIKDELAVPMAEIPDVEAVMEEKVPMVKSMAVSDVEESYIVIPSEGVEEEIADGRVDETDFAAEIQGTVVRLGEEINGLMNSLGTPDSFEETVSNARVGSNKEYTYDGIVIHTKPKNRKDIINSIQYCGKEKTLSGIGIGSTRADIEAAYGIHYVMDPDYITYSYSENAAISFKMNGEECVFIELYWK